MRPWRFELFLYVSKSVEEFAGVVGFVDFVEFVLLKIRYQTTLTTKRAFSPIIGLDRSRDCPVQTHFIHSPCLSHISSLFPLGLLLFFLFPSLLLLSLLQIQLGPFSRNEAFPLTHNTFVSKVHTSSQYALKKYASPSTRRPGADSQESMTSSMT